MIVDIQAFASSVGEIVKPLLLGFPRVLAMMSIAPLLPTGLFPTPLRNGICLALLLPLYPVLYAGVADRPTETLGWIMYMSKEMVIGAAIGWAFGVLFWAFESVGNLMDIQTGTATGATFDPLSQQQAAVFAQLLRHFATAAFIGAGGVLAMARVLYESYRVWPLNAMLPMNMTSVWELARASSTQMLSTALAIALPFIVLLLLLELGLGLLNRSLPQLNVFQLSMPIKMLGALIMLGLAVSYLGDLIAQFVARHQSLTGMGLI